MQHFSVTMAEGGFGGPEPGRGMGAARPDGAVFAMVERKIVDF